MDGKFLPWALSHTYPKKMFMDVLWRLVWSDDCTAGPTGDFFTSFNTTLRPYWGPTETLSAQREHGFYRIKCDDVEKITAINQLESTFILHSLWQGRKDFGWPNRPVWGYWPIYSPHIAQRCVLDRLCLVTIYCPILIISLARLTMSRF